MVLQIKTNSNEITVSVHYQWEERTLSLDVIKITLWYILKTNLIFYSKTSYPKNEAHAKYFSVSGHNVRHLKDLVYLT
jgi:hypothetical protein